MKKIEKSKDYKINLPQLTKRGAFAMLAEKSYDKSSALYKRNVCPIAYVEGYLGAMEDLGLL